MGRLILQYSLLWLFFPFLSLLFPAISQLGWASPWWLAAVNCKAKYVHGFVYELLILSGLSTLDDGLTQRSVSVALALPACDTAVTVPWQSSWRPFAQCDMPPCFVRSRGILMMWSIVRNKGPLHLDMDERGGLLTSLKELSFSQ